METQGESLAPLTGADRYEAVNALWGAQGSRPCSRQEAERASRKLFKRFGKVQDGSPNMLRPSRVRRVRRCWIRKAGQRYYTFTGWPRLVHDVSHYIFGDRHPSFKPHAGGHSALELEISEYVFAQGWLDGKLKPATKAKPSTDERRAIEAARVAANLARWESKRRRAETAIRKLKAKQRRLSKLI